MTRRRTWMLAAALGGALLLAGALWLVGPMLRSGTGFAAHTDCAVRFLAGRGAALRDIPPNPLVPLLRTSADAETGRVEASVLGLFARQAWFVPDLGCIVAAEPPGLEAPPPVAPPPPGRPWPDGQRVGPPPPDVDAAALEAALDAAFAEDDPEGRPRQTRAVVVVHGGRIVAERYAEGFDAGTRQLGWSMTKSVANALVGRLVHEGVISLDATQLMPGWQGDDPRARITLDQLLRMASGLEWDETYQMGSDVTEMLYLAPDMGRYAAAEPLAHPPGRYQSYSSGTTNIICDVLHRASGMGVEMARELVFAPLSMSSALVEPDASGGLVCSSYGWATPRDWARFGLWFLREGEWDGRRLLPEGWVAYSTRTIDVESEEEPYGAHWWVNEGADGTLRYPELPRDAYWASGHDGQRVVVVPSADLVVVRMGFTPEIPGDEIGVQHVVARLIEALA
jgi:CubicO group peptidase (beta-lactamase class C family)